MVTFLDSSPSTNSEIQRDAPHGYAVAARAQTAGRGQRGNVWEAEPGKNVSMSVMLRPKSLPARNQFWISEAVALAVADTVADLLKDAGRVKIKWPNDIYVDDRKIAGILIENSVTAGLINGSVAGIGVNVNQAVFHSDAPNPVSIFQLTGVTHDVEQVCQSLLQRVLDRFDKLGQEHGEYFSRLYRINGLYPFRDNKTGQLINAVIERVDSDGAVTLRLISGVARKYYFKEVGFL